MKRTSISLIIAAAVAGCSHPAPLPTPIISGQDVFSAMHERYADSWYDNLTFTQHTLRKLRSGKDTTEIWTETLASPARLRIDMGTPPAKRGAVFTADSTYLIGDGKLVRAIAGGNPLVTLLHAVYRQPVAATLAQLEPLHIDMTRLHKATWEKRAVWVVGAEDNSDVRSPQVWVDAERLVVVRMIQADAAGNPLDVRMQNYREYAHGWVAMHVVAIANGVPVQTEDYTSLRANLKLDPRLFDPAHWNDATRP